MEGLKNILKGNIVILGMGNPLRGDEGAGSLLARRLNERLRFPVFDAGTVPESFLAKIISSSPDAVLVIESISHQSPPGSFRVFLPEDLSAYGLSNNYASLIMSLDILREKIPHTSLYVLGLEPKDNSVASSVSEEIKETLESLENFFLLNYSKEPALMDKASSLSS